MISITILTKNSERLIGDVLESVSWAPEVIVLDTGSTDHTLEIAATFPNVTIHQSEFIGFGPLHNKATKLASNDWIFSLDSDEVMAPELAEELQELILDPTAIYAVKRQNYFHGKWIRHSGWWPNRVVRLYSRRSTTFSDDRVHERVLPKELTITDLAHNLHHYSYHRVSDFLEKMQQYSDLWAYQMWHKKRSSLLHAIWHSWSAFIKTYLLKLGFLDGVEGYMIAKYNAQTAYYKYLKLKFLREDQMPTSEPHVDSID